MVTTMAPRRAMTHEEGRRQRIWAALRPLERAVAETRARLAEREEQDTTLQRAETHLDAIADPDVRAAVAIARALLDPELVAARAAATAALAARAELRRQLLPPTDPRSPAAAAERAAEAARSRLIDCRWDVQRREDRRAQVAVTIAGWRTDSGNAVALAGLREEGNLLAAELPAAREALVAAETARVATAEALNAMDQRLRALRAEVIAADDPAPALAELDQLAGTPAYS